MERRPLVKPIMPSETPGAVPPARSAPTLSYEPKYESTALSDPILLWTLIGGLVAFLILPMAAAGLAQWAQQRAITMKRPADVGVRTTAFMLAAAGAWGLAFYIRACCTFARAKGRSPAWGLFGLLGLISFILIPLVGSAAIGLVGVVAILGVVIPYSLPEDRLALVTLPARSTLSLSATLLAGFGIFAGVSLAYMNSFWGGMTLDNKYIIEEYYHTLLRMDPTLQVRSWKMIGYIFQNDYWWPKGISGLYRPLVTLSYWANYVFGDNQLDPFQFHVVNFIFHWAAAFLAFLVMRKLTGRFWVAFFTGLLFATHPIATESVSNIIGRADVLAAISVFGCLLFYIRSVERCRWTILPWIVLTVATTQLLVTTFLIFDSTHWPLALVLEGLTAATGIGLLLAFCGETTTEIGRARGLGLWAVWIAELAVGVLVVRHIAKFQELPSRGSIECAIFIPLVGVYLALGWRRAVLLKALLAAEGAFFYLTIGCFESVPTTVLASGLYLTIASQLVAVLIVWAARRYQWRRAPWLFAMMLALTIGLFSKESAAAVVGVIVVYDIIFRWTLEDLWRAIPSLIAFCVLGAIGAGTAVVIGRFGALGLSEGLKPVLMIFLVCCLLGAVGLAIGGLIWMIRRLNAASATRSTSEHASSRSWLVVLRRLAWLIGSPWKRFFICYFSLVPPVIGWVAARGWVFANSSPPETPFLDNPIRGLGFFAAKMTAADVFLRLMTLLVWPRKLSCDYSFNQIPLFNGHQGVFETLLCIGGLLLLLGMLALVVLTFKKHKAICFLILFFLIAYLPTSNFLLVIGSIMAERFLYLPLLGFVGCVAIGVDALVRWIAAKKITPVPAIAEQSPWNVRPQFLGYGFLIVLSLSFGIRSIIRNRDWLSDVTLWTAAAKVSPVSFRSYQSKAFALFEQYTLKNSTGAYATNPEQRDRDIDEIYQTAEHAKPIVDVLPAKQNSSRLYLHLGMYYSTKGESLSNAMPDGSLQVTDAALPWFHKAVDVLEEGVVIDRTFNGINYRKELDRKIKKPSELSDVGLPPIYFYLGSAFARVGDWKNALRSFIYMRHLDPTDPDPYVRIATIYMQQNRGEDAAVALVQSLVLDGKRTQLWQALGQAFSTFNHSGHPALTGDASGRVQLHLELPEVRSVMCSAYQGFVRVFLQARRFPLAKQFRDVAVGQMKFPPALFDDEFNDAGGNPPTPPSPDEP